MPGGRGAVAGPPRSRSAAARGRRARYPLTWDFAAVAVFAQVAGVGIGQVTIVDATHTTSTSHLAEARRRTRTSRSAACQGRAARSTSSCVGLDGRWIRPPRRPRRSRPRRPPRRRRPRPRLLYVSKPPTSPDAHSWLFTAQKTKRRINNRNGVPGHGHRVVAARAEPSGSWNRARRGARP